MCFSERRIDLPFPSEHPYYSHMSRFALFPKFNTPDDPVTGDPSRIKKPIPSETPATSHNVAIFNKTKGMLICSEKLVVDLYTVHLLNEVP